MAYLLRFGQTGRTVNLTQQITAPASTFAIEYTVAITNGNAWQSVFGTNVGVNSNTVGSFGSERNNNNNQVNVYFTLDGKARVIYISPVNFQLNTPFTIRIEWLASTGQIKIYQDGNLLTTYNNYWTFNIMPIVGIGQNSFSGDLYYFRVEKDGTVYNYDPSASNGTGTTLIDTVGGNNGTLINFPTDNSQWVFYDDGGAITAATAFTMPQFSVSASASNSVPVFAAESAFTMPQFSVAAQAGIDAGQITAAASFAMPQFSVSAAASSSVPVFSGSISFTMPQFTVAAQASSIASGVGASVSFTMPQFTVAANAESTLPDYIASAAFTMPQFVVQVVSGDAFPTVNARALFKMPQFTVESETRNELFNPPGTYIQPTNNPNIYII